MLTRSGLGAAVVALITAVAGVLWSYEELMVIAAGIVAALLVALWSARRPLSVLVYRSLGSARVARGDPIVVEYHLTNRSASNTPVLSLAEPFAGAVVRTAVGQLAAGAHGTETGLLPTDRRGVFDVGPLTIERTDPLGLAVGARAALGTAAVLVHPRVYPLDRVSGTTRDMETELTTRRSRNDALSGFVSLREYVPGDDPRMIHWPTTARSGQLMVREHVENRTPELTVVLDTARHVASEDDFEEMADVAASLALQALRHGLDLVVRTTDRDHPGSRGPVADELQLLRLLAVARQVDGSDVLSVPALFTAGLDGTTVTIVTGPNGPSSRIHESAALIVIRIGAGAAGGEGVAIAAPDAAAFAARWAGPR